MNHLFGCLWVTLNFLVAQGGNATTKDSNPKMLLNYSIGSSDPYAVGCYILYATFHMYVVWSFLKDHEYIWVFNV